MVCSSRPPLMEPLEPKGRAPEIEDRGGLFRVWRKGWALRLDERSEGSGFDVFIVVVWDCVRRCFLGQPRVGGGVVRHAK